jgi:hypothetical protein
MIAAVDALIAVAGRVPEARPGAAIAAPFVAVAPGLGPVAVIAKLGAAALHLAAVAFDLARLAGRDHAVAHGVAAFLAIFAAILAVLATVFAPLVMPTLGGGGDRGRGAGEGGHGVDQ